ncbi:uracil-DNA glycosylase [Xylanimonas protaetiae]|uniref:Type-5 uracil-DNA glycosylase n=1 Tax=Xylanimonas protaetiae TaxID=2509457 RepID=A0A4P6F8D7_9MICO|nr:uracil-DNA glycosylase [Xylanimonas protaetiae]QAY71143.1 uracil-DNA glycosylase [Xylanimonas protaetiae]
MRADDPAYPTSAASADGLDALAALLVECRACPRLVAWREQAAAHPRASFRGQTYWARPVPGFGDDAAGIAVVGLAPAADGGNRTGRMFTGDRSGDFLFAALHRVGLASQPESTSADDGMVLTGVRLVAPVRCAPPANKPTPEERRRCGPWLARELALLGPGVRVVLALGAIGWDAALRTLEEQGWPVPHPRPRFAHDAEVVLERPDGGAVTLLGSFHPSPHNTFTGRLTPAMLDATLGRAKRLAGIG